MAGVETRPVGIAKDEKGWYEHFEFHANELGMQAEVFDINRSDWMDRVRGYSCVVWRPSLKQPWLEQAQEKIQFMEFQLGLRVFPNWKTFSTYDNKKAQAYFFLHNNIPAPETFISYSPDECEQHLTTCKYPFVSKTSGGSSSKGVRLIRSKEEARREVRKVFGRSLAKRCFEKFGYRPPQPIDRPDGYVLWQQLIEGAPGDCRVTVIAKKYVFVFYRRNRPGDFRASGSELIEYESPCTKSEAGFCLALCRQHDFDVMAFDLLFKDGKFYVLEMSYAYGTHPQEGYTAHDRAPTYYALDENEKLVCRPGPVATRELYMRYVAEWVAEQAAPQSDSKETSRLGTT